MKAHVYNRYGAPDVLKLLDIEKPVPGDQEVLIKVHASSVTPMDYKIRSGKMFLIRLVMSGLFKPKMKVLGVEFSGEIEAVGNKVTQHKIGEKVFGRAKNGGAHAQFLCVNKNEIALNPSNMSFEEAAGITFGATTALCFLRDGGNITEGQKVLINGASGGVGTFAVQLAKHYKAEVTAVCSSSNLDWVKELGANKLIDYTKQDFTKDGEQYDIIFDCVAKRTFSQCKNSLNDSGIYLSTVMTLSLLLQMIRTSKGSGRKAKFLLPDFSPDDLLLLKQLIEEGKLRTVIDKMFPINKIVEAHTYAEKGHAKGKVIVSIKP
jgi:NADPH:quinone reductase-like Zn-dependent oxidoreductase